VYLAFAFAGSRAGVKSVLMLAELNSEGSMLIRNEVMLFDGHAKHPTIEGPKFYKRNGYYYIFAPAGGVTNGWQVVLRSKNIYGPYEEKIVMMQGNTEINGPHQGAWIDTKSKEDWFIHFQDKGAYGRIVHLQPMRWINDWPVIGIDSDGDGIGEPVLTHKKPDVGIEYPAVAPPENDEFNTGSMGLQWQWQANPKIYYGYPSGNLGFFRLNCFPRPENDEGLWNVPNMLLQKFPAEEFIATTKLTFSAFTDGEETGFVVMGEDYQYISLKRLEGRLFLRVVNCKNARTGGKENELLSQAMEHNVIYFRVKVEKGALCTFSFSAGGKQFKQAGSKFQARQGRWIGAKLGYFALREGKTNDSGTVDIDWFRIEKL
jgi:beta-xylosidase